jgi:hypothetical protein
LATFRASFNCLVTITANNGKRDTKVGGAATMPRPLPSGETTLPNENEWLFDAIWELSDHAEQAGLPMLAAKLEDAMDAFLAEHRPALPAPVVFQSARQRPDPVGQASSEWDNAQANARSRRRLIALYQGADKCTSRLAPPQRVQRASARIRAMAG